MVFKTICDLVCVTSAMASGSVLTVGTLYPFMIYRTSNLSFKEAYKAAWEMGNVDLRDYRRLHTNKMSDEEFRQKYPALNSYLDKMRKN